MRFTAFSLLSWNGAVLTVDIFIFSIVLAILFIPKRVNCPLLKYVLAFGLTGSIVGMTYRVTPVSAEFNVLNASTFSIYALTSFLLLLRNPSTEAKMPILAINSMSNSQSYQLGC